MLPLFISKGESIMSDPSLKIGDEWKLMVAPIIAKLQLSTTLNMDTTFNADGSAALAKVLEAMASKLDIAVAMVNALEEDR
jgi:hypothetical protein